MLYMSSMEMLALVRHCQHCKVNMHQVAAGGYMTHNRCSSSISCILGLKSVCRCDGCTTKHSMVSRTKQTCIRQGVVACLVYCLLACMGMFARTHCTALALLCLCCSCLLQQDYWGDSAALPKSTAERGAVPLRMVAVVDRMSLCMSAVHIVAHVPHIYSC